VGVSPAHAAEPFIGRWAVKPEVCKIYGDTPTDRAADRDRDLNHVVRRHVSHRQGV